MEIDHAVIKFEHGIDANICNKSLILPTATHPQFYFVSCFTDVNQLDDIVRFRFAIPMEECGTVMTYLNLISMVVDYISLPTNYLSIGLPTLYILAYI